MGSSSSLCCKNMLGEHGSHRFILPRVRDMPHPHRLALLSAAFFQGVLPTKQGEEGEVSVSSRREDLYSHDDLSPSRKEKLFHLGRLMKRKWDEKVISGEKAFL